MLGYLNPAHLVGGALKLNAEKARAVFAEKIAKPLGLPLERGGLRRAPDRGVQHDPRHQGGVDRARPRSARVRAVRLRRQRAVVRRRHGGALGISRVVVPPSAGLFSSFGLLYADVEHHYARTFRRLLRQADLGETPPPGTRWPGQASDPACRRGLHRRRAPAPAIGRPALQGPELRAHGAGARRPDRCADGRRISRRPSPGARADVRPSRRRRRAGRAGLDPARRVGPAQGSGVPQSVASSRRDSPRKPRVRPISATPMAGWRRLCWAAPTSPAAAPVR